METTKQYKFKIPNSIKRENSFTYCLGCDHGEAIKLVAQTLDELNLRENTIAVASSGCSVFLYDFLNVDCIESPHGRACAVATGVKRAHRAMGSEKFVFTYQGDGDFASIGISESLHASLRGENITAICINNTNYGMTGGQLGPTSVMGQITTTSPTGRNKKYHGYPIKTAETMALSEGTVFSARAALFDLSHIYQAKAILKRAFEYQLKGEGFSFVEILANCPTNWKMTPQESHDKIRDVLSEIYPIGVFKDIERDNNNE